MSSKPRIVILSAFLSPFRSGAEAMVEEVSARLNDRFDIIIITARLQRLSKKQDTIQGVGVRRVGFGLSFDKWLFPFFATCIAIRLKPQIVHAVLETYAGMALVFIKMLSRRSKRMLTLQTTNSAFMLKSIHASADAITAISSVLLLRAKTFHRHDAIYIPNGIDTAAIRKSVSLYQRVHNRILFVGRLEPMKGIDILLNAFAQLDHPEATLRIVGDGSQMEKLKALAKDLHIADRVSFAGFVPVPAIYDEFAQAEIFCGLSRSEALGNVFLEAQAAGCAVIGTNVGGIPEIVNNNETGLLVPSEDPKQAALAMHELLSNVPKRQKLIEQALVHVKQFDWNDIAERYARVYERVLSDDGKASA